MGNHDYAATGATHLPVTPIEHLIVIVGENLSFDNVFATYEPPPGQTVGNLLSRELTLDQKLRFLARIGSRVLDFSPQND